MPLQAPQWTEYLTCPICGTTFNEGPHIPITLGCSHTICKLCLTTTSSKVCPLDQSCIERSICDLPVNFALLQLVGFAVPEPTVSLPDDPEHAALYRSAKSSIEELAIFLKPMPTASGSGTASCVLSRPLQRKLVSLINCQLVESEGRERAVRAARSLGERCVTELILLHQNAQQLSANLWAAVRARGCQFLGPAMQEEVLKLILLALEDGSALSRKVLVLFVVQRLEAQYPQASKTAIGHVVQLLYRASCFKVTKREEESSLMQLKDEYREYENLRREHDSQIVQIAAEAGLRIAPEQWSSLLYGDQSHKSHMQSIIDKLQSPQSFSTISQELLAAIQRTGDPANLGRLRPHLEAIVDVDPDRGVRVLTDAAAVTWQVLAAVMSAVRALVQGLVEYLQVRAQWRNGDVTLSPRSGLQPRFKTTLCRDFTLRGTCPRGQQCTFAHSQRELERHRGVVRVRRSLRDDMDMTSQRQYDEAGSDGLAHLSEDLPDTDPAIQQMALDMRRMHVSHTCSIPVARPSGLYASSRLPVHRQTIYTSSRLPGSLRYPQPNTVSATSERVAATQQKAGGIYEKYLSYIMQNDDVSQHSPVLTDDYLSSCIEQAQHIAGSSYLYPIDQDYYRSLSNLGRGMTAAEHLDELSRRRSEIINHLDKPANNNQNLSGPYSVEVASHNCSDTSGAYSILGNSTANTSMAPTSRERLMMSEAVFTSVTCTVTSSWAISVSCSTNASASTVLNRNGSRDSLSPTLPPPASARPRFSMAAAVQEMLPRLRWQEEESGSKERASISPPTALGGSRTSPGMDSDDEFVPWDNETQSKYGPISRHVKTRINETAPVQVTASLQERSLNNQPVTAVTPLQRPYAVPHEVPSQIVPLQISSQAPPMLTDHAKDPRGTHVASSLPTAIVRPNLFSQRTGGTDGRAVNALWTFNQRMLNIPAVERPASSNEEHDRLRHELAHVSRLNQHLQESEDARLRRELVAVEQNMRQAARRVVRDSYDSANWDRYAGPFSESDQHD